MEEKEASKESMYKWLDALERKCQRIREHVDPLPEEGQHWTNDDFLEVAKIMVEVGKISRSSQRLYEGIYEVLGRKIRIDAGRN